MQAGRLYGVAGEKDSRRTTITHERQVPAQSLQDGAGTSVSLGGQSSVVEPPAAAILSRAAPEKASTVTLSATESSPEPRTFTGRPRFTAPRSMRPSTVTSPP